MAIIALYFFKMCIWIGTKLRNIEIEKRLNFHNKNIER